MYDARSDESLYLPITRAAATAFLESDRLPDLSVERGALFAMLLAFGTEKVGRGKLHAALQEADRLFAQLAPEVGADFLRQRRQEHPGLTGAHIDSQLERAGIVFASPEAMASRSWCGADGRYTSDFQKLCHDTLIEFQFSVHDTSRLEDEDLDAPWPDRQRQSKRLRTTTDQARVAGAVAANPDEHFDLSAYAGSGKTHLMLDLSESLGRCAHLAPTAAHRYAFEQRGGLRGVRSYTQHALAVTMMTKHMQASSTRWVKPPNIGPSTVPLQRQAEIAGIPAIGTSTPPAVLMRIFRAIKSWCFSGRSCLEPEDFSWEVPAAEKPTYLAHANRVWELMFDARAIGGSSPFSTWLYHAVKWLDLVGAQIPDVGVLLVDEAHDLSSPWMHLLDRYANGWVLMGDPYQRLKGRPGRLERVKTMSMAQSVRTGEQATPMIEAVIRMHSDTLMPDDLRGSRDHITYRREYRSADEAPGRGLRVYGSEWQLLADALRLKDAGNRFRFVPTSGQFLLRSSYDAIELYRHGGRPKQFHLSDFRSWDALATHLSMVGQDKVARLIERGYSVDHADALLQAGSHREESDTDDVVTLGLLEHCKNLEASLVFMSPCCFEHATTISRERDRAVKAVYLAMTRVRDELWYPGVALENLAETIAKTR
jgi:hypothetical protein